MTFAKMAVAAMCLLASTAMAQQVNLVQNPGFEGRGQGWDVTAEYGNAHLNGAFNHGGYSSFLGTCLYQCPKTKFVLSQVLGTTAGQAYELDFWSRLDNFGSITGAHIAVNWDGVEIGDFDLSAGPYLEHSLAGLVATSDLTTLALVATFSVNGGFQPAGAISLDDFSVVASATSVPEPASMSMAVLGLIVVFLLVVRRRRADGGTPIKPD